MHPTMMILFMDAAKSTRAREERARRRSRLLRTRR
jgi:hypothetical protein